jgi:hypothetical protein
MMRPPRAISAGLCDGTRLRTGTELSLGTHGTGAARAQQCAKSGSTSRLQANQGLSSVISSDSICLLSRLERHTKKRGPTQDPETGRVLPRGTASSLAPSTTTVAGHRHVFWRDLGCVL